MKTRAIWKLVKGTLRNHSTWLVPAASAAGVITTGYLSVKAGMKANEQLKITRSTPKVTDNKKQQLIEDAKETWKLYIPPVIAGATTVALVGFGSYSMSKRTLAAVSAASLTEKAFTEYKKSVVDQIGANKERKLREQLSVDNVLKDPPDDNKIIVISDKQVTCHEAHTGRYFKSDMETLRRAENEINSRILHELYVTLDEFYALVGLPRTASSSNLGWDSDRLLELKYAATLYDDNPCLTFEYSYIKAL